MIKKRKLLIGDYDTDLHGQWTLASCKINKASQVQTIVPVPGRYAPLDYSTYLTDGQPYYGNASLSAVLESSEGDRQTRQARIDAMINHLDGKSLQIIHPDHPGHYLVGRVQVCQEYNDMAHCAVSVNALCEPWMYAVRETVIALAAVDAEQTTQLINAGRLAVVPTVTVTGEVSLTYSGNTWALGEGEYLLPELYLTPGTAYGQPGMHELTYKGTGTVSFAYREAVLAG